MNVALIKRFLKHKVSILPIVRNQTMIFFLWMHKWGSCCEVVCAFFNLFLFANYSHSTWQFVYAGIGLTIAKLMICIWSNTWGEFMAMSASEEEILDRQEHELKISSVLWQGDRHCDIDEDKMSPRPSIIWSKLRRWRSWMGRCGRYSCNSCSFDIRTDNNLIFCSLAFLIDYTYVHGDRMKS